MKQDLIVIGGGPGGYVAAIRAAQLGKSVTLVEKENAGGTCLNWGCIPTKALYREAELLEEIRGAGEFGITTGEVGFDLAAVRARKAQIVARLTSGVKQLLKGNGVSYVSGEARFTGPDAIEVNGETLQAEAFLIATGSKTAVLPVPGITLPGVMDSREALEFAEIPQKLVVIGGGVIGVEMAGIYRAFGAEVSIVEFMPQILPMADGEAAKYCARQLRKRGIEMLTATKVTSIAGGPGAFTVTVEGEKGVQELACTHVLSCAGRVMNVDGLGLERAGVSYDRKGVKVDENYRTNVPGIYAIGDVTGRVMLAHVASDEGRVAVERMCGMDTSVDYELVPNCIFTFPEIAAVGKTEEALQKEGVAYASSKFAFAGNGKAQTLGETDGFVKILASEDMRKILGVHIIGPHASDLIHTAIMAMRAMLTVEEAARTMYAHPTLAESLMEATQGLLGEAIHMAPKRR